MTKYQSVKVMFDLDDEYQLRLYEHLKNRTNGSSYIRTLLHQDMNGSQVSRMPTQPPFNEIVKEQNINDSEQSETVEVKPDMKSASVKQTTHHNIKLMVNNKPIIVEDEMFYEDLI